VVHGSTEASFAELENNGTGTENVPLSSVEEQDI
jgi:hypothetical protein